MHLRVTGTRCGQVSGSCQRKPFKDAKDGFLGCCCWSTFSRCHQEGGTRAAKGDERATHNENA
jgi:hypothetical protein